MLTQSFIDSLPALLGDALLSTTTYLGEITCEIAPEQIVEACTKLRDDPGTCFETLIDLCGMDYSSWGAEGDKAWPGSRFAVVYHLLSLQNNQRLRLRVSLDEDAPEVDSLVDVWPSADWYEREAFDLFGIIFLGHPDLRRLLTDYGFIGHPFRKDFPLSGQVEMRYDEEAGRVGLAETEDDFDFGERFGELKAEFKSQIEEEKKLNKRILGNLNKIEHEK